MGTVNLARKDAREAAKLLREFQLFLESAIESAIAPGETEAFSAIDSPNVASDRLKFKRAEGIIRRIDIALGDRKGKLEQRRRYL